MVALDKPIKWNLALPPGISAVAPGVRGAALFPASSAITGCILSSLMPAAGLRATVGAASFEDCVSYWDGFARMGIKAAPLHCGSWSFTARDLYRFRSQADRAGLRGHDRGTAAAAGADL